MFVVVRTIIHVQAALFYVASMARSPPGGGLWYRPGAASAATPASTPAAAVATLAIVGP